MPNRLLRFWQEIKRRNVPGSPAVDVGKSYVFFEISCIIFPRLGLHDRAKELVLYLLIDGLHRTFIDSWKYDITPEKVHKTVVLEEIIKCDKRPVSISSKIAA